LPAPFWQTFMIYDVVIVGAGAAGLMCAIQCPRPGAQILLLDGQREIGAKILMSGGTRCNVTNRTVSESQYHSGSSLLVKRILAAFPPAKTIPFFKNLGVSLQEEPGGKLFPKTHDAKTVLEALKTAVMAKGVKLQTNFKVTQVLRTEHGFSLRGAGWECETLCLVLCTGGLSYPTTGSDGTGYTLAHALGHALTPTTPALTPLMSPDPDWRTLTGLSLPCRLTFWEGGRKKEVYEDPLLFTHFGFSGPVALDISRHWVRSDKSDKKIAANFLPHIPEERLRKELVQTGGQGRKTVAVLLAKYLPDRFVEVFLKKMGIEQRVTLAAFKREDREKIIRFLHHYPLEVNGVYGYRKAEVTAGGIPLSEVHPKTLESKIQPGLFFAGEIFDVDGQIGGYNFQWAWSSATVAALGVHDYLERVQTQRGN